MNKVPGKKNFSEMLTSTSIKLKIDCIIGPTLIPDIT